MKNEIIIYQSDELTESIEVKLEDETVWLNQEQIALLFKQTKQNISLHINNCFKENELDRNSTVKYSLTVHKLIPTQGVFFEDQVFDAYKLTSRIIRSTKKSIVLIDNYIDENTLTHLSKKDKSHDRFLIIDQNEVYHLRASLKDLGKKWFAFSKLNKLSVESMLNSIAEEIFPYIPLPDFDL